MKLFSLSFIGKAKEWYDNISPGEITTWDTFQALFIKIFLNERTWYPFMTNFTIVRGNQGRSIRISMTGLISS
jgi:hypothetical protein